MDTDAYLERIGLERPRHPDLQALTLLQRAHLLSVPFENLDIWQGTPIELDVDAMFDKIVRRRRGGYCYELNGLFARLLENLGFQVMLLSGRTVGGVHGELGPEFDHLLLRVDLEAPWLVDVGFGDTAREPVPLHDGSELVDSLGRTYRLERAGEELDLRERLDPASEALDVVGADVAVGEWRTQYRFSLVPHELHEFEATSRWQQTESPFFTGHRFCTIATRDGRRTLMDSRLIERSGRTKEERIISEPDVPSLLLEHFGVRL